MFQVFYGVLEVGLNAQQNSPAAHCSAIQNPILKLNLNFAEIALSEPVPVFSAHQLALKYAFSIMHRIAELQYCMIIS